ncbi:efflux RND transporter periplasmic adaptor subunit [Paracoccus alkanivorans]|uniref:Efflux RND transporter periplasmic adaptor subunit n=1 Tax=Paracoccus alkanivorans TaxID=2116655 RepID=A0A3M0M9V7_9RHOB|nr:efflux RND transporter periplasmic adaptor subunit [Paracoccus alkanivorans]RMC32360.1 efflux RND transporter periplasmic adaptor subunit [Paracoccus alkanivorans]
MSPEPSNDQQGLPAHRNDKPAWAKTARELRRETAASESPRRLWPWGLLGLLVLALAAVAVIPDPAPPAAPSDTTSTDIATILHPLDVITVRPQKLRRTLPVSGTLHPHMQVEIASRTTGLVEQVGARLGERVSQGDLLLQIESDSLRAELLQQQAALEANRAQSLLAEAQKQRSERLSDRGLTAAANLESSRSNLEVQAANLEMQRAAVSAAEIALRDTRILAPFDGVIAARKVDPGQTVANGTTVFELADLSSMLATMDVPVARTVLLKPGQRVHLTSPGLPGREFIGRVDGISPVASEGSRNSAVTVRVDNPDGLLRGGMFVNGQIEIDSISETIAIPHDALREDVDGHHVLKISNGHLIRQPVEIDPSMWGNALIAITSGLETSDRIVSGRLPDLREGMQVRVGEPR